MNKNNLGMKKFEEILSEVLDIRTPRSITYLKFQIKFIMTDLIKDMERNYPNLVGTEKFEAEKQKRIDELNEFMAEKDLETVLRECIAIRAMSIQSYEAKIKPEDSEKVREEKLKRIKEAHDVANIVENIPSLLDFMDKRRNALNCVDYENPEVKFDKSKPKFSEKAILNPYHNLDIRFFDRPSKFPNNYEKVLEDAGIYAYRFGGIRHSILPDENNRYTENFDTKELVGIIKKDEFGNIQRYSVLMDKLSYDIPPEFYRDVLFSDVVLQNSYNNCGYLGEIRKDNGNKYGHRIFFDGIMLSDFIRALYYNDRPELVEITSNYSKVKNVNEAMELVDKKLENALNRLFAEDKEKSSGR